MVKRGRLAPGDPMIEQYLLKGQSRDWPLLFRSNANMILNYQAGKQPGLRAGTNGAAMAPIGGNKGRSFAVKECASYEDYPPNGQ
jgi:hypothetical protein